MDEYGTVEFLREAALIPATARTREDDISETLDYDASTFQVDEDEDDAEDFDGAGAGGERAAAASASSVLNNIFRRDDFEWGRRLASVDLSAQVGRQLKSDSEPTDSTLAKEPEVAYGYPLQSLVELFKQTFSTRSQKNGFTTDP